MTLPVRPEMQGRIHPISQTIDEIVAVLGEMGFNIAEGPDIEDDWHNFTALNIPRTTLPARNTTPFTCGERWRTWCSPPASSSDSFHAERRAAVPLIVPGRTYRCDYDATHSPMFHQVEGLVVDKTTHMGNLKGCLIEFCRAFFDVDDLPVRFRASYFPFTEPSAEVDSCTREGGAFRIGHGDDWLEILGCGMVNPRSWRTRCGSERIPGFAFGMGVERWHAKYGIRPVPSMRPIFAGSSTMGSAPWMCRAWSED